MKSVITRLVAVCAAVIMASCGTPSQAQNPEAFVVKGRVVDESGAPVARAQIVADNQFLYDSNVTATTGPDGRYRINLPRVASTWNMSGTVRRSGMDMTLAPNNPDSFAGNRGAVRNFTLRTSGTAEDGSSYGGKVIIYKPIGASYTAMDVQLRLEPVGGGTPIMGRVENTGDGYAVSAPLGTYRITATLNGRPLQIRVRNQGSFAPSVTTGFNQIMTGIFHVSVEVE